MERWGSRAKKEFCKLKDTVFEINSIDRKKNTSRLSIIKDRISELEDNEKFTHNIL